MGHDQSKRQDAARLLGVVEVPDFYARRYGVTVSAQVMFGKRLLARG